MYIRKKRKCRREESYVKKNVDEKRIDARNGNSRREIREENAEENQQKRMYIRNRRECKREESYIKKNVEEKRTDAKKELEDR